MQFLGSLSTVADVYDAFVLDLWGCLHDGSRLYPGAYDCLKELRQRGKKIVFLSNAPRRTHKAVAVLDQLGVDRALYDGAFASGEAGYQALKSGALQYGPRYLFIGPSKDADVVEGLPYQLAGVEEADFLLNVGFGSEAESMDEWDPVLAKARVRNLPMLCLNPDMEVVKITGERYPCAGVIAKSYEKLGGKVAYFGKPYPEVYASALAMMGNPGKAQVLAVGDSLHTDVLGAKNFGIASALVTGGILHQELGDVSAEEMRAHLQKEDVHADYVLPGLVW